MPQAIYLISIDDSMQAETLSSACLVAIIGTINILLIVLDSLCGCGVVACVVVLLLFVWLCCCCCCFVVVYCCGFDVVYCCGFIVVLLWFCCVVVIVSLSLCNQHFDGIWNPKNLEKHRFGPETLKSNPCMEWV